MLVTAEAQLKDQPCQQSGDCAANPKASRQIPVVEHEAQCDSQCNANDKQCCNSHNHIIDTIRRRAGALGDQGAVSDCIVNLLEYEAEVSRVGHIAVTSTRL
ncbi:hypothetical protein D3C81_1263700 [compost metagenome]